MEWNEMGRKCHEGIKCLIYIRWMKNDKHTHTFCKMGIREAQKNGPKKDPNHRATLTIKQ